MLALEGVVFKTCHLSKQIQNPEFQPRLSFVLLGSLRKRSSFVVQSVRTHKSLVSFTACLQEGNDCFSTSEERNLRSLKAPRHSAPRDSKTERRRLSSRRRNEIHSKAKYKHRDGT